MAGWPITLFPKLSRSKHWLVGRFTLTCQHCHALRMALHNFWQATTFCSYFGIRKKHSLFYPLKFVVHCQNAPEKTGRSTLPWRQPCRWTQLWHLTLIETIWTEDKENQLTSQQWNNYKTKTFLAPPSLKSNRSPGKTKSTHNVTMSATRSTTQRFQLLCSQHLVTAVRSERLPLHAPPQISPTSSNYSTY